jgi:hypothetical protein
MDGAAQVQWSQVRSHPGTKSQLQPPRGALRKERFHQGIGSKVIMPKTISGNDNAMLGPIGCQSRLGGLLNYYHRKAA